MRAIREIHEIDYDLEDSGVVGTHSESCYEYHVACLAVLVRDVLTPSNASGSES